MADSPSFLDKIADFLISSESGHNLYRLVVLPNRRSQVFLKQALAKKAEKDIWLPDMLTIDELMAKLSGLTVVDPIVAYFELFKIHLDIEKENARGLDDFLSWAPLMLNDFSDVDYYLADAHGLFHELSEVKALEQWNVGERPLSGMQKAYLAFFHSLFGYYEQLQKRLLSKKTAYKAMAYRMAAGKLQSGDFETVSWNDFVFVGFNALTEAEKQVVAALKTHFQLHYFIDADRYYFDSGNTEGHEAGLFLRGMMRFLKCDAPQWVGNALLTGGKEINIVAVSGQTGQAKYAGQLLHEWLAGQKAEAKNIAVVLADEQLLIPLLGSVPATGDGNSLFRYNVTMGYPLRQSPFYDLINRWLQLLILRQEDASSRISLPALEGLMQNPLMEMACPEPLSGFLPLNRFYMPSGEIMEAVAGTSLSPLFRLLFHGWDQPATFVVNLKRFLVQLKENEAMWEKRNRLLQFQLSLMMQVLKLAEGVFSEMREHLGFMGIQKILLQLTGRKEVSLKGEPLTGIQVMGMLETRNLDFDRVIILGANEGILPKTGFGESFIPYDLRQAYHLPLQNTKTAVTAYHFFRLLQHAQQAVMVYNSEPDVMGGGEVSRLVLQIENELAGRNPKIRVSRKIIHVPLNKPDSTDGITITKDKAVMSLLKKQVEKGISPSALNTYVRCPLLFYYRYVARIDIPVQPEVSVQSNTFGSVVHGVLDRFYKPFKGKMIDVANLNKSLKEHLDGFLSLEFQKHYGRDDLKYGRDLLMYNVARKYVERFVLNEISLLKKEPRQLVDTEKAIQTGLHVEGLPVVVRGFIDRIDKNPVTGEIRIIDYKTGRVDPGDLKLKSREALLEGIKFSKALQVLVYAWLYHKEEKPEQTVTTGIIGLRTAHGRFMPVSLPHNATVEDALPDIENVLKTLVSQIMDEKTAFWQTETVKTCEYCDYRNLCSR